MLIPVSLSRAAAAQFRLNGPLAAGLLLLLALAAYGHALRAPFVFDDPAAIATAARLIRDRDPFAVFRSGADPGETLRGRPLLALSFAVNYAFGADRPWGYRATNVGLHVLAALTLWGIVRRTLATCRLNSPAARDASALGLAAAALWLAHPLQTQAVTYVVQRAEALSALFVLLTLYCHVRARDATRARAWRTAAIASALLGMATKETAAVAPLLVWLYDWTFGAARPSAPTPWWYWPGLASGWLMLAALVASTGGRGGTAGFDSPIGPATYFLTQLHAIPHYLALALWPHPLVFDYGTWVVARLGDVWPQALALLALAAVTVHGIARRTAAGFFGGGGLVLLAPSSSFVPIASQTMAEHRVYLALATLAAPAVFALHHALGRRSFPVLAALALVLAGHTHLRNTSYASESRLWAETAARRPQNARAHHNLGVARLRAGDFSAAAAHLETAARHDPASAEIHYDRGLCLQRLGRPADAAEHYRRALALRPSAAAHNNLGATLLALDRAAEAAGQFRAALALDPTFAEAQANLADALLRAGDAPAARGHALEAARLKPGFAEAHFHAGNAAAATGQLEAARRHYEDALRLAGDDPRLHNNLGNVLLELDQPAQAIASYERALRLQPDFIDPRRNLALLLWQLGRPAEAAPHLDILLRALPADPLVQRAWREARAAAPR